jgi:hypothetical protein
MKMVFASLSALMLILAACNTDTITPPAPPAPPLTTPVGTNVGSPVTQTVGASGGTITAGGVKLEVLPGTLSNASLTLQPITDTLNGSGQGVAISSDTAWSTFAVVRFPIDPSDEDPEGLGIAVQQANGSWRALEPVKVDVNAGTISVGLPANTEVAASSLRAQAGLNLKRLVKVKKYFFKRTPSGNKVKVKKTQTFVPYAQVVEKEDIPDCKKTQTFPPTGDPEMDDLTPIAPSCTRQVTREYPFTNNKNGFTRLWAVNAEAPGNSTIGTISPTSPSGATYTAPDKKPNPDTVTVTFQSLNSVTRDNITLRASVKIEDEVIQKYTGSVKFNGSFTGGVTWSGEGNLTWTLIENKPNDLNKYQVSGTFQATTLYPDCTLASGSVPVQGTMIVFDPVRNGPTDTFASKYWFTLSPGAPVLASAQCGNPRRPEQVAITFNPTSRCPEVPTMLDAPKYTDIELLTNSGSWSCRIISTTANWNFTASQ